MGQNPAVVGEALVVFLLMLGGLSFAAEILAFLSWCHAQDTDLKNSHRTF